MHPFPQHGDDIHAQIVIRRAEERDRSGLEAISTRTWDGNDYLPRVFSKWLADSDGEFYVAVLPHGESEQIVGAGKVTRLADGEWWLEGLRVDPDYYKRGIGGMLHRYGVQRVEQLTAGRAGVLRLSTNLYTMPVHKLAASTGFTLVGRYVRYSASAQAAARGAEAFRPVTAAEIPAARTFLNDSRHFDEAHGSTMGRAWKCYRITDARLSEWSVQQQLYGWFSGAHDALRGVLILGPRADHAATEIDVIYLDALEGRLAVMSSAVRGLAARLGYETLRYMMPIVPDRLVAIEQAGWRRPPDGGGNACLFSRPVGRNRQEGIET